jgi:hypothetical protein
MKLAASAKAFIDEISSGGMPLAEWIDVGALCGDRPRDRAQRGDAAPGLAMENHDKDDPVDFQRVVLDRGVTMQASESLAFLRATIVGTAASGEGAGSGRQASP